MSLIINLNSKIINPVAPEMQLPRRLLYQLGIDAFCKGRNYFDLLTTDERRGYKDCCDACAEGETEAYLASQRGN